VPYIIAEPCIGVKDTACVDACPVDCIHPKKDAADQCGLFFYRKRSIATNL
jgi:NAD-dependent dihydropyrimidine dehydrogenase PreA subunit